MAKKKEDTMDTQDTMATQDTQVYLQGTYTIVRAKVLEDISKQMLNYNVVALGPLNFINTEYYQVLYGELKEGAVVPKPQRVISRARVVHKDPTNASGFVQNTPKPKTAVGNTGGSGGSLNQKKSPVPSATESTQGNTQASGIRQSGAGDGAAALAMFDNP